MSTPRIDRFEQNLLINGDFRVNQRGTTVLNNGYMSDRWLGTTGVTSQTIITSSPSSVTAGVLRVFGSSGNVGIKQRVETSVASMISDNKITVAFWARVSTGTTSNFRVRITIPNSPNNFSSDTEVGLQNVSINSVWNRYVVTFDVNPVMITNGFCVQLFEGGASIALSLDFAEVVCVQGDRAPYGFVYHSGNRIQERDVCTRYFWKSYGFPINPGTVTADGCMYAVSSGTGVANVWMPCRHPFGMHAVPVVTVYNPATGATWSMDRGGTAIAATVINIGYSGFTIVNNATTTDITGHRAHFTADAEL